MCATCGCSDDAGVRVTTPGHPHDHDHDHGRGHGHAHHHETPPKPRTLLLEQDVLAKNDRIAQDNREWLRARHVLAVNLMSSPGSGKTTLVERTVRELGATCPTAVVEGDQETTVDADRIKAAGAPVVQVNTGAGCHLDADMLRRALDVLNPAPGSVLFVENVGNLVCPALFDLGESCRVVVMSVTEGQDKPRKYPHMFGAADLILLNKVDLLPYVDFDVTEFRRQAHTVNPGVRIHEVSATRGDGLDGWYRWLQQHPQRTGDQRRAATTA
ncbi:MAG TPA: hydrogenase nickel incorporation protein HypB [Pseudonocardiaceae bacterium]